MPATVGIVVFPDVEVLDFAGPFEVFSVASRIGRTVLARADPPFRVVTVANGNGPVVARHGLQVTAHHSLANAPRPDVLIIPGGIMDQPLADPVLMQWIAARADEAHITASVCTGASVLARLGLLSGLSATTHWEDIAQLRAMAPDAHIVEGVPYRDEGRIVTSAGISAGIVMSLHLVHRLAGRELAVATARQMQYDWEPGPVYTT